MITQSQAIRKLKMSNPVKKRKLGGNGFIFENKSQLAKQMWENQVMGVK